MSCRLACGLLALSVTVFASARGLRAQCELRGEDVPQGMRIVVPNIASGDVVIDGTFSDGEWGSALRCPISDNVEVYLLADSANLYVAFRFLKDFEADFVSEVYLAVNDREFLNLHSSGALGEDLNSFSPELRKVAFTVGKSSGWESNVSRAGARIQAKEYRIGRERLPGRIVRMAGGMTVVNRTMRENANFPKRYGFGSASGWVELVLPG